MGFLRLCRLNKTLVGFAVPLLLAMLVAFTYQDAPKNDFHFDDGRNITRHPPVMIEALTVKSVLNAGRESFLSNRPLPSMTFAIDWWRGDGTAEPFLQTNIAIHAAAAIAVFALFFLVLSNIGYATNTAVLAAFAAAALWACHPIQVQAVTYIVQRMASMAALFTVLTVLLYVLGRIKSGWRSLILFALAGASWLLGMASKETAAIAPFLCLLAEHGVIRHGHALVQTGWDRLMLAVPVIIGLLIVVDIWSAEGPLSSAFLSGYVNRDFTLGERLLTQPRVIAFHLSQFVWPVPDRFSLVHDFPVSASLFSPATTFAAVSALVVWCCAGIWTLFWRRSRVFGFFLLWVPAALAIESSFIALEMVFEHRMYLPSVGLTGLAALGIAWALQQWRDYFSLAVVVWALVVSFLVWSTSQQVPIWKSELRLAQSIAERSPNSARAWSILASALHTAGHGWNEVMPPVKKSLELNPNQLVGSHLRALYLISVRRFDEAGTILKRLEPKSKKDHSIINTIGMLHLGRRNYPAAVAEFERVARLDDFRPEYKYNLALSYELAGRCNEAWATWQIYLEQEVNLQRIAAVEQRLARNFVAEGGRCFGGY